jgi:hypothetical protein
LRGEQIERKRETSWTEGNSERGTHGQTLRVAGRGRGGTESHRHQENERNKTKGKIEVML